MRNRWALGTIAAVCALAVLLNGCAGTADWIANAILANAIKTDDREMPQTAYAIPSSADDVQILGGQGLGLSCSLPPGVDRLAFQRSGNQAPVSLQMRQACAFHDFCYRHGNATYGYAQADCDFLLQQHAFRLCKQINADYSVADCETNARKVTLGVRIGGAGSFKRADAIEDHKAATFFEFDPYPVRAAAHTVVRLADAPKAWLKDAHGEDAMLPKAAYFFEVKPSGTRVSILGWRKNGARTCAAFELPAGFNALNGPPMVVRDSPGGEDWFVWWKRESMQNTKGHFALLPPGRATRADWMETAGGFAKSSVVGCKELPIWNASDELKTSAQIGFTAKPNNDLEFSEIHAARDSVADGVLRLIGLTTHSCGANELQNVSSCLIDVELDVNMRRFKEDVQPSAPGPKPKYNKSPTKYRAHDQHCAEGQGLGCDRYRNYVTAPYILSQDSKPYVLWLRRGTSDGTNYRKEVFIRRFALGATRDDQAQDLGEQFMAEFPEDMDPAALLEADTLTPTFLSLSIKNSEGNAIGIRLTSAAKPGEPAKVESLDCLKNTDASWMYRPSVLVRDVTTPHKYFVIFSRSEGGKNDFESGTVDQLNLSADLQLKIATIENNQCTKVRDQQFSGALSEFLWDEEKKGILAAVANRDKPCKSVEGSDRCRRMRQYEAGRAQEIFGKFLSRTRGGQLTVADVSGDGVPDLILASNKVPADVQKSDKFPELAHDKFSVPRSRLFIGRKDADAGLVFDVAAPRK